MSPRTREVLILLAQGHTPAQVAQRLGKGVKTVYTQRVHGLRALGLRTTADLFRYAVQAGWVSPLGESRPAAERAAAVLLLRARARRCLEAGASASALAASLALESAADAIDRGDHIEEASQAASPIHEASA
jgi:DNA-binding CsgD family transcriptional regulator